MKPVSEPIHSKYFRGAQATEKNPRAGDIGRGVGGTIVSVGSSEGRLLK